MGEECDTCRVQCFFYALTDLPDCPLYVLDLLLCKYI